jgi:alcohol dehydrogenase
MNLSLQLPALPGPDPVSVPGSAVPLLFGPGTLEQLGRRIVELGGRRVLLVTDEGIRRAGHLERAMRCLYAAGLAVVLFDQVAENPTTDTVLACWRAAHRFAPDIVVGLGGGSAMDTAKGFNFIYTNGGRMADYRGWAKAAKPLLPMIAVPTTSGTGSEAQSYALISDAETHVKMACGDPTALPRLAILDPDLAATQPARVAAATGIDAITHAVETSASTRRTERSRPLSRKAWELLEAAFEHAVAGEAAARAQMLLGAHLAGAAIENSMLGGAHATANPLTAEYGITHGIAVGLMMPSVILFNCRAGNPYADLAEEPEDLIERVGILVKRAGLPETLRAAGVPKDDLPRLAEAAAGQWTGKFNPVPLGPPEMLEIYRLAW